MDFKWLVIGAGTAFLMWRSEKGGILRRITDILAAISNRIRATRRFEAGPIRAYMEEVRFPQVGPEDHVEIVEPEAPENLPPSSRPPDPS